MKKIKSLFFCLLGLSLVLPSCNSEDPGFNEEPTPDPYDTLEFYSIEYDFSKKEIKEVLGSEYKESFENNSDQIIPMTFYPYLDQGKAEFQTGEMETSLDGLKCEVPVPSYKNDAWSETETNTIETVFGETTPFNPTNGNVPFTQYFDPWETTRYDYVLTFSELVVPFEAIFIGENYGDEHNFTGILKIRVPINCDIKIEDTAS